MRKGKWFARLVKKGYSVAFANDDARRPDRKRVCHSARGEKNLGRARDLLQKGRTAEGLQQLNALASKAKSSSRKAQIAALAADSEFKAGRFEDATEAYRTAGLLVASHPRAWLRPAIGEIRSLLKNVKVAEATATARQIWTKSAAQLEESQRQLALHQAALNKGAVVHIKQRPHRASVVASRLGNLFLLEGEIEQAKEFFANAISVNPNGASRARQGLAEIALREGNLVEAERRSREVLLLGKYQAKTIAIWRTLIAARQRQGITGVDAELLAGLRKTKISTVRARATLAIAQSLRSFHDPSWESIAQEWLTSDGATHPVIALELQKLSSAGLRRTSANASVQAAFASELLKAPQLLSLTEYIATSKQLVGNALTAGQSVNIPKLVKGGVKLFGRRATDRLNHALALAAMTAKRPDLARPLLQTIIARGSKGNQSAKSLWALARMEAGLKNYVTAAQLYQRFATERSIPLRFRLLAQMKWAEAISAAGNPASVGPLRDTLLKATGQIGDFDLLLDFARQLKHGPEVLQSLARELFDRGQALALSQFKSAQNPSAALGILFRLTRREVYDFGKYDEAIKNWENLSPQQRNSLWSPRNEFWEYLSWVFLAMTRLHRDGQAQELLNTYLSDPATPLEGRLQLLHSLATWRARTSKLGEAISTFSSMIALAPTHRLCAEAYYWLALAALKRGDQNTSIDYATKIQVALGSNKGLLVDWQLDCKAALLRSRLVTGTALQPSRYDESFQAKCLAGIHLDLRKI